MPSEWIVALLVIAVLAAIFFPINSVRFRSCKTCHHYTGPRPVPVGYKEWEMEGEHYCDLYKTELRDFRPCYFYREKGTW